MITLFKKIRKRLLGEGRFTRYLIYAIGEIALVMIGILLALQINNWNQEHTDRSKENQYYHLFLQDIILDKEIISKQINSTETRLMNSNRLINELQSGENDMTQISASIGGAVSRSNFDLEPTTTTYEDIKSSGNIDLLRDIAIKSHLDNYYVFAKGIMNTININAARLGERMITKEDAIGTGLLNLAYQQNAFDSTIVNVESLLSNNRLSEENKNILMNDAVFYASLTSRNLQHLQILNEKVSEAEQVLQEKCNKL